MNEFRLDDPTNRAMPYNGYPAIISRKGEVVFLDRYEPKPTGRGRHQVGPGWRVCDGQDEQPTEWVIPDAEIAENWRLLDDAAIARIFAEEQTMIENKMTIGHLATRLRVELDEARNLAWEWRICAAGYIISSSPEHLSPEDVFKLYPFPWEETK